ncbi:MAG: hypothetical protein HKN47_28730 [Pirellulaceae bacterium]|nr:hypothetical protein [Pirellulaceae bacterium]
MSDRDRSVFTVLRSMMGILVTFSLEPRSEGIGDLYLSLTARNCPMCYSKTKSHNRFLSLACLMGLTIFSAANVSAYEAELTEEDWYIGSAYLQLDESHDLVLLRMDGDDIEIEVFMFNPAFFPEVPNTLDLELLEDLASDHFDFEINDVDDHYGLLIACGAGNDVVRTDPNLTLGLVLAGQAGNDYLQGSNMDDGLVGGEGSDQLFGFGGDDLLSGNLMDADNDHERDYLTGGAGHDTFHQWTSVVTTKPTTYRVTNLGRTSSLQNHVPQPTSSLIKRYVYQDSILDYQSWNDEIEFDQSSY